MEGSALFSGPLRPMLAADVARLGYAGLKDGRAVVITGLFNKIMAVSAQLSPSFMVLRIANWMNSTA
jgi:short-subunit dehydrogenase